MLNFNSILVFSEDPGQLVVFYQKVFEKKPDWEMGEYAGFQVGNGQIIFGPHDKVHGKNGHPERIMFNFETEDVEEEYQRILGVGAKSIAEPYHPSEDEQMWLATLEDPDGNYFQLGSPMTQAN